MDINQSFADRLRSEMGRRELECKDLANALSVSHNTVINWRNGRSRPRVRRLIELADQLDVTTDWLLGLEP